MLQTPNRDGADTPISPNMIINHSEFPNATIKTILDAQHGLQVFLYILYESQSTKYTAKMIYQKLLPKPNFSIFFLFLFLFFFFFSRQTYLTNRTSIYLGYVHVYYGLPACELPFLTFYSVSYKIITKGVITE